MVTKEEIELLMAANNYTVDIRLGYPREMDETDKFIYNAFVAGAEWQYQKDREEFAKIKAKTWCEGFDAHKEQMLKDAVEASVEDWNPNPHPEVTIPLNSDEFIAGDKVRIVVIKVDEE